MSNAFIGLKEDFFNNTLNIHIYKWNNIEHYADSSMLCDLFPSYNFRFCIIKPHVFIFKYETTNAIDIFSTPLYFKIAAKHSFCFLRVVSKIELYHFYISKIKLERDTHNCICKHSVGVT